MTQSDSPQDAQKIVRIGGSVEQALAGNIKLDIRQLFLEAWQNTRRNWGAMTLAIVAVLCLTLLCSMLLIQVLWSMELDIQDPGVLMQSNLLLTIVMAPLLAGIVLLGLRNAVDLPCKATQVFDVMRQSIPLALTAVITSLLSNVGLAFMIIPGVYLLVATSMATPLVVEKRLSPLRAIAISLRAVTRCWFNVFALYLIMLVLFVIALIPMGLGLLWVAPLYYNLKGIIYRELFGIQVAVQPGQSGGSNNKPDQSGIFHA